MGVIADKLVGMIDTEDRYDMPFEQVREAQIQAMNERFQEQKDKIKVVAHRAAEAGITEIRSHSDMARILLPHTAYKSYPESWLMTARWDRLGKWLDTVSAYRVPPQNLDEITDMDDWILHLQKSGHYVSCSSGTTGKSAMLVASKADIDRVKRETISSYTWGSGVPACKDRRIFGVGAAIDVPRNRAGAEAYDEALQDPQFPKFVSPMPQITVGSLTKMIVLRKKIAEGTATPSELAEMERVSAERQKAVDSSVELSAKALVEARGDIIHLAGYWGALYDIAKAVREMGYSAKDFRAENSIYGGGGLKGAKLPEDYREFVYDTFNIKPHHNYLMYSMQELGTAMPRCQKGGRYHLPPWLVPLILDKAGETLLPITNGEIEGRAAFFDLSLDGRWGGVISGDKVSIDFRPCACGARGPSIRDDVTRYSDLEGDDKIGCAGTVDAYVRGIS